VQINAGVPDQQAPRPKRYSVGTLIVIDFALTSMNETTEILKVDAAGRVQTPRDKQEPELNEFERSGMTGMQSSPRHRMVARRVLWAQA